ncbi:TonB-dependent receptor [Arcticibacterium luteifluviistationis]|uniref:TonB-dependent receptor n=2 Tax=Arcticibacterium luteifluviistationis TaxID=1784714 RepID=A0A2Z4GII6_9BACT|nr:TonB-dependent receptor [Arcticibacterium luteifluviistationis]
MKAVPMTAIILSMFIGQSFGQSRQVTGKIISAADKSGLPSASVLQSGTSNGVMTDLDGNFKITVSGSDAELVFSYIGYVDQEVVVGNQSIINVELAEDANALSEVVVIGYGSQKKSDMTGSVSSVDAEELGKFATSNAAGTLQGRMAGVRVSPQGGSPDSPMKITIRGSGTLSDAGPLYVIDGMLTGGMGSLNPQDIESVSVLKDASATAIYGSRAANGVIIVTTKKGKSGDLAINFNASTGFQKAANLIDWANARQYADIVNRARDNDGNPRFPSNDAQFNPNVDSDIQRESLRNAPISNIGLSIGGGSKNTTMNFSVNHMDQTGIVKESDFSRTNIRVNSSFTKGRFKLQQTLGVNRSVNNPNNYFSRERDQIPTVPIYDENGEFTGTNVPTGQTISLGNYSGVGNLINSLGLATIEDRTVTSNGLIGNVDATLEILKGLKYRFNVGVDMSNSNNYTFTPKYKFNDTPLGNKPFAELNESNSNFLSLLTEHTLNYFKTIGKTQVDILGGYSSQVGKGRSLGIVARNFPSNDIRVASAASDRAQAPSNAYETGLLSYFGRANVTIDGKYLLTATLRRDGSSLFREDLRWGTFPSAAVGWNISNESFMQNVSAITNLKLRASYGEIGSNNVNPYAIDPELNLNSDYIIGAGQTRLQGYSITKGVNPNITWETTKTMDIGLDFNMLQNKLQFTLDYFNKNSEDVLVALSLPLYTGFGNAVPFNTASIKNNGFEFQANYYDNFGKDFKYSVSANFTTLNNEVTALGRATPIIQGQFTSNGLKSTKTDVGHPIGAFYGFVTDGIYQTDEEALAANDFNQPRAGDLKFKDLNGDGKVDNSDQDYIGNPAPGVIYGLNFSGEYKSFDMTFLFDGVAGNKILNGTRYRGYFDTEGNYLADALNGWTPSNTNTDVPRNTQTDPGYNRRFSDFYLEDGSFFRLKNVQVGYSIKNEALSKIGMTRARIYVSSQNLFTLSKYTGYYPEVGSNTRSNPRLFNEGVDEGAYPMPKNYQIGLQVNF